jgi:hypothetical protein
LSGISITRWPMSPHILELPVLRINKWSTSGRYRMLCQALTGQSGTGTSAVPMQSRIFPTVFCPLLVRRVNLRASIRPHALLTVLMQLDAAFLQSFGRMSPRPVALALWSLREKDYALDRALRVRLEANEFELTISGAGDGILSNSE